MPAPAGIPAASMFPGSNGRPGERMLTSPGILNTICRVLELWRSSPLIRLDMFSSAGCPISLLVTIQELRETGLCPGPHYDTHFMAHAVVRKVNLPVRQLLTIQQHAADAPVHSCGLSTTM